MRKERDAITKCLLEPADISWFEQNVVFVLDESNRGVGLERVFPRMQIDRWTDDIVICQINSARFVVRTDKLVQVISERIVHDFVIYRFAFPFVEGLF